MKILFLIGDAFGIGGTIRTTFNLAEALAERHDVEVLSMFRRRDVPQLPVAPAVRVMALVELREQAPGYARDDPRRGRPSSVFPPGEFRRRDYDLLVEQRAAAYLRASDADVAIATRAGLIAYLARFAPERMIRIGQEHLTRAMNPAELRRAMVPHHRRLDALVTVSGGDAEDYRRHVRLGDTRLLFIANCIPRPSVTPADDRPNLVVAAGRLVGSKRYDVLIRAFAKVLVERPEWSLRIYGVGEKHGELRALIQELGLYNSVLLMGSHTPIESEWAKCAIAAVTSDKEPFGMTIVEAMRCGTPVVSTTAPYGPEEIITDGADGRLVPVDDADAIAAALLGLIADPQRRRRMGAAALTTGERYDPATIARRYEELFAELAAAKAARAGTVAGRLRTAVTSLTRPRAFASATAGSDAAAFGPARHSTLVTADCTLTAPGTVLLRLPATGPGRLVCQCGTDERAFDPGPEVAVELRDGAWLVFLERPDGTREPVLAGVRDTRALLEPLDRVAIALPHRRPDGQLGIRVWRRDRHAEVGEVRVVALPGSRGGSTQDTVAVAGRLFGVALGAEPALLARSRPEPAVTYRAPVRTDGDRFRAALPYSALVGHRWGEHDAWDLYLDPGSGAAGGGEQIRLARLMDDVFDKKAAYAYPDTILTGTARGTTRVRPYYTDGNGFSLLVSDQPG